MATVYIQEQADGFTSDMYDAVNERMGTEGQPPEGLIVHTLGRAEDGRWMIVDVWESSEAADRFRDERLIPAITAVMSDAGLDPADMPEPRTTTYETHDMIAPAGARAS